MARKVEKLERVFRKPQKIDGTQGMTKKEKELIKKAISLIHHKGDHYGGLNILAKMVGWEPVNMVDWKSVNIIDIISRKENSDD